jgi:hypothetical protein
MVAARLNTIARLARALLLPTQLSTLWMVLTLACVQLDTTALKELWLPSHARLAPISPQQWGVAACHVLRDTTAIH